MFRKNEESRSRKLSLKPRRLVVAGLIVALMGCGEQNVATGPESPVSDPEDSSTGRIGSRLEPKVYAINCVPMVAIRTGFGPSHLAALVAATNAAKAATRAQYLATFYNPALCPAGVVGLSSPAAAPVEIAFGLTAPGAPGAWFSTVQVNATICTMCN